MLDVKYKNIFEKDVKRLKKRNYDFGKLKEVMNFLVQEVPLPLRYRDHPLKGNYTDHRECHIAPDWLLIYLKNNSSITFVRTGTHADLFK